MRTPIALSIMLIASPLLAQELVPEGQFFSNTDEGCALYSGGLPAVDPSAPLGTEDNPVVVGPWAVMSESSAPTIVLDGDGLYSADALCVLVPGSKPAKFQCSGDGTFSATVDVKKDGAQLLLDGQAPIQMHRCDDA